MMLSLEALTVRYGPVAALDGVTLSVVAGEILCLLGPSGSGKSTLLRLVAGVEHPSSGRIVINGVEVAGARTFVEPERRRVGMVFQDYALFPHLSVRANVAFGLVGWNRADVARAVDEMLERVELTRYAGSYPHMLSGGERQRVALARALAPHPQVLLMDEPFSSLDGRLRDQVRQQTIDLLRETGTTTVLVTHDPREAVRVADRIALLRKGRLVQCGSPEELYTRPATSFAASMFSEINELSGICRNGRIETPLGSFAAPHLAENAPCSVCIRPQHLRIAGCPTGICAQVLRSEFLGETDLVVVSVPGLQTPITVRTSGRVRLSPGDAAYLEVHPRDVLVVSHDQA
jgi:iron(III) transport system ATP-binding protein